MHRELLERFEESPSDTADKKRIPAGQVDKSKTATNDRTKRKRAEHVTLICASGGRTVQKLEAEEV